MGDHESLRLNTKMAWESTKAHIFTSCQSDNYFMLLLLDNKFSWLYPDYITEAQGTREESENGLLNGLCMSRRKSGRVWKIGATSQSEKDFSKRLLLVETIEGIQYQHVSLVASDPAAHILVDLQNTDLFSWAMAYVNAQQELRARWLHSFLAKVAARTPGCDASTILRATPGYLYYGWYSLQFRFYKKITPLYDHSKETFHEFPMEKGESPEDFFFVFMLGLKSTNRIMMENRSMKTST
jgi:hypothetical protein